MDKAQWQRTWVRALTTGLTIAMMVVIFLFSMQDAERSDRTSGFFSDAIIHVLYPNYNDLPAEEQKVIMDQVQFAVRKTAHFTEYMILGILMRLCMESWFPEARANGMISFLGSALYAASDELHQRWIDGRSGQWQDVLLDSCGVLAGVLLGLVVIHLIRRRK